MIELKIDEFKNGKVTFHISRQDNFLLPEEGVKCGRFIIKKDCHPEARLKYNIFFIRGSARSLDNKEMCVSINDYIDIFSSISIFNNKNLLKLK